MTIKIQDSKLLCGGREDRDQGLSELQRFLLLLPFFLQQFIGKLVANKNAGSDLTRQSTTLFSSNKSILQLLKKSLLSITIADKKEILNILDQIQEDEERNIKQQFQNLIEATIKSCLALNYRDVIFESL